MNAHLISLERPNNVIKLSDIQTTTYLVALDLSVFSPYLFCVYYLC